VTAVLEAAPPAPPALTQQHLSELATARSEFRPIRRAISIARFDAWCIGIFAVITLLFGLGSASSILMGGIMLAVATVEMRGARRLGRLDAQATTMLAANQLALATLLVLYAVWCIWGELRGTGSLMSLSGDDAQLAQMLKPFEHLTRLLAIVSYAVLIIVAVVAQGGLAVFYHSRRPRILSYQRSTPGWIISLHQADVAI
jgi:hypothetical protein